MAGGRGRSIPANNRATVRPLMKTPNPRIDDTSQMPTSQSVATEIGLSMPPLRKFLPIS
jgi:hypothetical protein